ncbi:MAG: TolC family protein [Verrucomicrobiales bacterium]|nr:TolC family protein [Verrucomicrobiales bacterium]
MVFFAIAALSRFPAESLYAEVENQPEAGRSLIRAEVIENAESEVAEENEFKKLGRAFFGPKSATSGKKPESAPASPPKGSEVVKKSDKKQDETVADRHDERLRDFYPDPVQARLAESRHEVHGKEAVSKIFEEVAALAGRFDAPELDLTRLHHLPEVPQNFEADWRGMVGSSILGGRKVIHYGVDRAYTTAITESVKVRSFVRLPKVQEAIIRENRGIFAPEVFGEGDAHHGDQPTGSTLTTGETGRFLEDTFEGEYGLRKRLDSGGEMKLSQRLSSLKNNSEFLDPNPQTGSEVVLSIAQPLLRGAGKDYARSEVRLAQLVRDFAVGESLRLIEDYLLEVNNSYWGLYLSRAALAQRQRLTEQTSDVVKLLEDRQKLDDTATVSELYRARATMNRREADLRRTQMAVSTAEQRLRSLVRDPELPMGAAGEMIPATAPQLGRPAVDIQASSREALLNRSEMAQASSRVRSAAVRLSQAESALKPQLDLIGEVAYAGIANGRSVDRAIDDMNDHGTDLRAGLRYSMPIGNESAKATVERRQLEYDQTLDDYRIRGEEVLLQTLIAYQDLLNSYQDMSGKYQSALASRKEIEQIRDRIGLAGEEAGNTIAYQLQLQLDAMDRNQVAEEEFLVAIVAYNSTIANLQRAMGVLLQVDRK